MKMYIEKNKIEKEKIIEAAPGSQWHDVVTYLLKLESFADQHEVLKERSKTKVIGRSL